jgi:ABC-type sugar transport system substrate-binding protein
MGYEGVVQAVRLLKGETIEERIDSGSEVVTRENLEAFLGETTAQPAAAE